MVHETLERIIGTSPAVRTNPENDLVVNYQGEMDNSWDPTTVVAQLLDPDQSGPPFLTGLRLPIVTDLGFHCPPQLL